MAPAAPVPSSGAFPVPVFHWSFVNPIRHDYLPAVLTMCAHMKIQSSGIDIHCDDFPAIRSCQLNLSDGESVVLDFSRDRPSGTLYAHDHPLLLVAALRILAALNANISTDAGVAFAMSTALEFLRGIPLPDLDLVRNAEKVGLIPRRYELHELPNSASHSGSVFF